MKAFVFACTIDTFKCKSFHCSFAALTKNHSLRTNLYCLEKFQVCHYRIYTIENDSPEVRSK
ncbi:CLUMA_CG020211, isoform A [Clunio marinus]|uniref:CLUMA_CG020211, isoform A n=1 Tax=Clunio marinus TaxID=568069 RepID=A0A1J1J6Y3_9DIPT|nr:CLUMA_CG020211, isoform A [Clunio marinus]